MDERDPGAGLCHFTDTLHKPTLDWVARQMREVAADAATSKELAAELAAQAERVVEAKTVKDVLWELSTYETPAADEPMDPILMASVF